MRSSNFIVAIIVILIINLVVIGISLTGIGSAHDSSSVDASITRLSSLNFEWAWAWIYDYPININLLNYFKFGSCGVDWSLSVRGLTTQTMLMSIQYDPCVARMKTTETPDYSTNDDQSKQATEFEGDIEGFEEMDFCKNSAKACASAGEVSGALYGTAFAFAFVNLVLHVMRFMEDSWTKCYIAGGLELLTLILMASGTSSFSSGCIKAAMKDLDEVFKAELAALLSGGVSTDDYFTDDVEKEDGIDVTADWSRYNGWVAGCARLAGWLG